jgi:hypothetical protein
MSHDVYNWGRHEIDILNFEKYDLVLQFSSRPKRVLTGRQAIHTVLYQGCQPGGTNILSGRDGENSHTDRTPASNVNGRILCGEGIL